MPKLDTAISKLVADYGEACMRQGASMERTGYTSDHTAKASRERTEKFNIVMSHLEGESKAPSRPTVTTLCGSTRFPDAFALAMMHLTLKGHIVLTVGMCAHADTPVGSRFLANDGDESTLEKQQLDQLHFRKIEMSDGIYVVNPGDYYGSSTEREIAHALRLGKEVEFMFPTKRKLPS